MLPAVRSMVITLYVGLKSELKAEENDFPSDGWLLERLLKPFIDRVNPRKYCVLPVVVSYGNERTLDVQIRFEDGFTDNVAKELNRLLEETVIAHELVRHGALKTVLRLNF